MVTRHTLDPCSLVETEKIVALAKNLISIPSISGDEHKLVDWLEDYFKFIGLTGIIRLPVDEAADTLVAWIDGPEDGPTLMLNFHVDTFNDFNGWETEPFNPVIKNRRLYGLGAHDMKGGTACLLTAVEAIIKSGVKLGGRILVTATTDEENWSRGAHALVNSGVLNDVDYCIVPEQSEPGTITIGQLGRHVFRLTFKGKAVHAVFEGGVNAVVDAAKAVTEIAKIEKSDLGYMPEYDKSGSICVTGINGGGTDILVPEYAEVWVDRHVLPSQTPEDAADQIHEAVIRANIEGEYQLKWDERPTPAPTSYMTPLDSELVKAVTRNLQSVTRRRVRYTVETSVADTNHIAVYGKVPTIILGPSGGNTCEANEYVEIHSLPVVTKTMIRSALDLLGVQE
ncbi:MAG: ArgE/DapE family deacylase [Candidatus Bathyarchaeota archaeon]|nr:ArgE/DapE family deacylase [Candidatus Bathyarchaeota archaeon]